MNKKKLYWIVYGWDGEGYLLDDDLEGLEKYIKDDWSCYLRDRDVKNPFHDKPIYRVEPVYLTKKQYEDMCMG